ncbi:MAG: hypothetical protein ACK5JT_11070 [Hyphomicrobiaceae bacterium]
MNILSGGIVTTTSTYIGNNAGANGTVSVSGTGASFSAANVFRIGSGGSGTFSITNGAAATTSGGTIGSGGGTGGNSLRVRLHLDGNQFPLRRR